jgi:hypothetical protein
MGETAEGYAWPESSGKYTIGITEKGAGVIALEFNEELATLKLNNKVVADYPDFYYDVEVNPTAASNAYAFEASDRAGNVTKFTVTVKVDTTAPTLTVKTPSANTLVGLTASGDGPMITLTGTANETLTGLAVLEDFGPDMDLEWVDAEVSGNGTNWSARFFLPAESGTHRYLVIGRDLAGNWSRPDPKSVRTVTIDTEAPVLVFDENAGPNSYQGDATLQLLAAPTTVVVKGTLSDTGSGPARVMIGSTEVKPKSAVQNFGFYQSIALKEGFTDLTIVGTDAAGNTSQSYRLRALVKTMIGTLTAKASFSTGKQFLTVSGTTDRAYLVDDQYIGVVPVTITVTKKSGGQVDSVTLDASTGESSLYNLSKGSFKYSFDMSGWSSGKYLVTITAGTPAEFPNVKPKTTTIIVTRP